MREKPAVSRDVGRDRFAKTALLTPPPLVSQCPFHSIQIYVRTVRTVNGALNGPWEKEMAMKENDEVIRLLCRPEYRAIVTVLEDAGRDLTVTDLAGELVRRDDLAVGASELGDEIDRTAVSLHHEYLPKLDGAGLLRYDADDDVITYEGISGGDAEWEAIAAVGEMASEFPTAGSPPDDAIGVLRGREDVYDYGRELADRADEELFLIYASEELLHEDCLPHARDAIERSVDFAAGAKSDDTRQFFRECLPEATVWEPQFDWMNERARYPTISRLVFADRENAVVGLWGDAGADGPRREMAMVGEGLHNPLVVLVRELLGPRLDHLDYQSEHFLDDLPFDP